MKWLKPSVAMTLPIMRVSTPSRIPLLSVIQSSLLHRRSVSGRGGSPYEGHSAVASSSPGGTAVLAALFVNWMNRYTPPELSQPSRFECRSPTECDESALVSTTGAKTRHFSDSCTRAVTGQRPRKNCRAFLNEKWLKDSKKGSRSNPPGGV